MMWNGINQTLSDACAGHYKYECWLNDILTHEAPLTSHDKLQHQQVSLTLQNKPKVAQ